MHFQRVAMVAACGTPEQWRLRMMALWLVIALVVSVNFMPTPIKQ